MTFGDSLIISVPIAYLLVRWFRRFMNTAVQLPQWDKLLKWCWLLFVVFLPLGSLTAMKDDHVSNWYLFTVACCLVAAMASLRENRLARTLLLAVAPAMLCFLASLVAETVAPVWFKETNDAFETSWVFASIWLITFIIIARGQKKTAETQRIEREAEAERTRVIEAQKAELERLVDARTAELSSQKEELQQTLVHLQAAQKQLIQAEKMASLGELTAGIAHEIQNPLNFVNNFAEVSVELIDELKEELAKPEIDADYIQTLTDDLSQSQQKIHHHGRRADAIVKAMLQHSRVSTDERKLIDLNALCDEFLRLSYHGLRAKDKSFNAELVTQFDPAVGKVMAAGQEMGRVLLNLFNNAFYSVTEKKKQRPDMDNYMPQVSVTTKRLSNDQIEVRVRDNGLGIPQSVLDKIYQPFFTTKPTGEGTGLGLSLSYDIITKGHDGTLTVNTVPDEFAEFVITLPTPTGIGVS